MICIADKNTLPFPSAQDVDCLLLDSEKDLDYLSASTDGLRSVYSFHW